MCRLIFKWQTHDRFEISGSFANNVHRNLHFCYKSEFVPWLLLLVLKELPTEVCKMLKMRLYFYYKMLQV